MKYKGIEIGEKPTLAMIEEFMKEHPSLGFVTDAKGIFSEGEKRKWKTSTYKPIKKLESFITGLNGALQQRTRWEKTRSRNKAKREKDEKKRNEEKTKHKSSDYSKLLQDPRWQKKRLEIMQRDNFTCQQTQQLRTQCVDIGRKECGLLDGMASSLQLPNGQMVGLETL